MNKGERLQYACGGWLVAGEYGIQDTYAKEVTQGRCGECWRRTQDAAPELLEALKRIYEESRDPNIERIAQSAIELTVVHRDAVQ